MVRERQSFPDDVAFVRTKTRVDNPNAETDWSTGNWSRFNGANNRSQQGNAGAGKQM